jgi:hypothetical protein
MSHIPLEIEPAAASNGGRPIASFQVWREAQPWVLLKRARSSLASVFDGCEGFVDRGFTGQDAAVFAVHHVADLDVEAHAVTPGVLAAWQGKLLNADFSGRLFLRSSLLLGQLIGSIGDRNITGLLVPLDLDFRGRAQEAEELGRCLVFLIRLAGHCEQSGTADEGLRRLLRHGFPVRQEGRRELIVAVFCQTTERARRTEPHADLAFFERLLVVVPAGAVPFEEALVLPARSGR